MFPQFTVNAAGRIVSGYPQSGLPMGTFGHTFAGPQDNPGDNIFMIGPTGLVNTYFRVDQGGIFSIGNLASTYYLNYDGVTTFTFSGISSKLGIGIIPTAKLHVLGVSASGANQRLEPVLGVAEEARGATVNTTDATTTTIQTVDIPTGTGLLINTVINCKKTAGAGVGLAGSSNTYIRTVKAKNVGGTVTIGTIQSDYTSEDIAAFNVSLSVSGTNVLIRVIGAVNDDVTWNCITKTYNV
jgi:hypothetical protein